MRDLPSVDGPHTPEYTAGAAEAIAELVRYLNHATLPHRAADALPYPSDVARLLGHLGTALERMPQLLSQLSDRLAAMADTLPLYSTDGSVRLTLPNAYGRLDVAATRARDTAQAVAQARANVDRLGVEE